MKYEDAYIEGYKQAIRDAHLYIEQYLDNELEEEVMLEAVSKTKKKIIKGMAKKLTEKGASKELMSRAVRTSVALSSDSLGKGKKESEARKSLDHLRNNDKDLGKVRKAVKSGIQKAVRWGNMTDHDDDVKEEMNKGATYLYKNAVKPKYDKESAFKKVVKGNFKGAIKKVAANAVSKIHKYGKKIDKSNENIREFRKNRPYTNEKNTGEPSEELRREARAIQSQNKRMKFKKNTDSSTAARAIAVAHNMPGFKYLPEKIKDKLIIQKEKK